MNAPIRNKALDAILFGFLIMLICGLAFLNAVQFLTPKGQPTCSSFVSYEDALNSFNKGNSELDADHDGIPCENMHEK